MPGRAFAYYTRSMYTITIYFPQSGEKKKYVADAWGYPSPGVISFREKNTQTEVHTNCRFLIERSKP